MAPPPRALSSSLLPPSSLLIASSLPCDKCPGMSALVARGGLRGGFSAVQVFGGLLKDLGGILEVLEGFLFDRIDLDKFFSPYNAVGASPCKKASKI